MSAFSRVSDASFRGSRVISSADGSFWRNVEKRRWRRSDCERTSERKEVVWCRISAEALGVDIAVAVAEMLAGWWSGYRTPPAI